MIKFYNMQIFCMLAKRNLHSEQVLRRDQFVFHIRINVCGTCGIILIRITSIGPNIRARSARNGFVQLWRLRLITFSLHVLRMQRRFILNVLAHSCVVFCLYTKIHINSLLPMFKWNIYGVMLTGKK